MVNYAEPVKFQGFDVAEGKSVNNSRKPTKDALYITSSSSLIRCGFDVASMLFQRALIN